jgi:hypothetical protein
LRGDARPAPPRARVCVSTAPNRKIIAEQQTQTMSSSVATSRPAHRTTR